MKKSLPSPRITAVVGAGAVLAAAGFILFLNHGTEDLPPPSPQQTDWREGFSGSQFLAAENTASDPALSHATAGTENQLMATTDLENPLLSIAERRRLAFKLAEEDPAAAFEALKKLAEEGADPLMQAALAEALGNSNDPAIRALIDQLAMGDDDTVAGGAVRGIASRDTEEAAALLSSILHDVELHDAVRTEAARGLGQMQNPAAFDQLLRASYGAIDLDDFEPVFQGILEGLGMQDFKNTADYFSRLLEHPEVDTPTRVAALEALADAQGAATPLLFQYAAHDDPDVREAASWALGIREDLHEHSEQLIQRIAQESNAEVRGRLYDAATIAQVETPQLWNQVLRETDPHAFLAGAALLAGQVQPHTANANRFDSEAVPTLTRIALESSSTTQQYRAIMALGASPTPGAREALDSIYTTRTDPQIQQVIKVARGY
jgi:hypothetical protein